MTNLAKTSEIIEKVLRQIMEEKFEREWVGLTEKEIDAIGYKYGAGGLDLMDELSAMLKDRNT
jgi:hypothetical protein